MRETVLDLGSTSDILTQYWKLREETCIVPEQVVSDVLVVIEVVSIPSENVTVMLSLIETPLWLSAGEVKETVGGVVSVVVLVLSAVIEEPPPSSLLLLQEMIVRLKRDMRIMYKTLFIFFLHQ